MANQLLNLRQSLFFFIATLFLAGNLNAADRPNIVWIVSEDNSIHYLDHFFPGGAMAPNIEALAKQGLTFDNAFSNAPVCSVARTTLATMCYGPRIGTQFHRRYQLAPMPDGLKMFPAYLRDAGYYTTNNSKKDYNAVEGQGVWDESSKRASWRNRTSKSQPFFHMESHAQSHEGSLHFNAATLKKEKTKTDPATIKLADYFPETETFRYTHARYHDRMTIIDNMVGKTMQQLEDDGLLDDTFVFYFGDHGGVLPRGKGYIYESGLHVPLIVRVPKNFRHLVNGGDEALNGTRVKGFVEFVDFGATTLSLAGVDLLKGIDGKPFLGKSVSLKEVNSRDETFGYADRFDEKYDFVRSVRVGDFQYIRNFQPYLPDGLQNIYRYKMLAYKEWEQLFHAGKLNAVQSQFFQSKPCEMLFDCKSDPHQVINLAADPKFRNVLTDLRTRLQKRMTSMPDLSLFPESYLAKNAMENPVEFGQANRQRIKSLLEIADLALLPFADAKPRIEVALESSDELKRYWAALVCTSFGESAKGLATEAKPLLDDKSEVVRIRVAEYLGRIGAINPQETLTRIVNTTNDPIVATEALNSIVWFKDFFGGKYPVRRSEFTPKVMGADMDDRLNYINGIPYPPKRPKNRAKQKKNQK